MTKEYTRQERREKLKEKYRRTREKMFIMAGIALVFLVLLSLLAYGISVGADPFLLIVLAVILLVMIPVSIFLNDTLTHEM